MDNHELLFRDSADERVNNNSFFPSQVCGHDFIKLTIVHFPSGEKWLPIRAGDRQTQKLDGKHTQTLLRGEPLCPSFDDTFRSSAMTLGIF